MSKKINRLFLALILTNFGCNILVIVFYRYINIGIISSLILGQLTVLLPAILFLIITKTNPMKLIQCKKLKISTILLIIVATYFTIPIITAVNAFSMLLVENEVSNMSKDIVQFPIIAVIMLIGVLGPINEEFVCRGIIYHGYRQSGRIVASAILSSVLFGMLHMNLNQMSYAIVMGIISVVLIEATGSVFSSMIYHAVINTSNVIMMYLTKNVVNNDIVGQDIQIEGVGTVPYKLMLLGAALIYLVIGLVAVLIAGVFIYLIARNEGRLEHLKIIFKASKESKRKKLFSASLIIAMILCAVYMAADVVLQYMSAG